MSKELQPIQPHQIKSHRTADRAFVFVSLGAVITASIAGFWLIGSPNKQRLLSLDQERVDDLRLISTELWVQSGRGEPNQFVPLPEALPNSGSQDAYLDPKTNEPYKYRRLSDTTYELCATFSLESPTEPTSRYQSRPKMSHPAGRHCYQFDASRPSPFGLVE